MTISIKPTASGSTIEQDGSTILTVDGSGNLTVPNNMTFSGNVSGLPDSGKILQVVNVYDRQQSSYQGIDIANGYTNYGLNEAGFDLTTLDATITPSSTSSKILILTNITLGSNDQSYGVMRMKRGIGGATPAFSSSDLWMSAMNSVPGTLAQMGSYNATQRTSAWTNRNIHFQWLDSPNTTSEVKYRFNFRIETDTGTTIYLNRAYYNTNDYGASGSVSSVTLMEVAG